jgi:ribonuclease HII
LKTRLKVNRFAFQTDLARVAGVDEAGRGPLAGPVTAAAVILDPLRPIVGLRDSKRLSAKRRAALVPLIEARSLGFCVAHASVVEIDRLNVLQATLLAMQRAVTGLIMCPQLALIDGNQSPDIPCDTLTLVGGDDRVAAISAASILAKQARDAIMVRLAVTYPGYGFELHKGYGTRLHQRQLALLGPTPAHRRSFAPVRALYDAGIYHGVVAAEPDELQVRQKTPEKTKEPS